MARYNKIFAGPVTQTTPQVTEAPAAADILPGSVLILTDGKFAPAGASATGKVYIAQDNYLTLGGVDETYAAGDVTIGMEMLDPQFFNARVASGINLSKGTALSPGADGTLVIAAAGSKMVVAFSDETFNNTTGSAQLVRVRAAKGYLTAAE